MHPPTFVRTGRPIVLVAGDGDLADSTLLVVILRAIAAITPSG